MHACEAGAAVDDHERDEVLQAKIRDGAVVDDAQRLGRHVDSDALDVAFAQGGIGKQRRHGIEHRLQRRPDAPLLDRCAEDGVARAKLGDKLLGAGLSASAV